MYYIHGSIFTAGDGCLEAVAEAALVRKGRKNGLGDICDGVLYQEAIAAGFFENPYNVSFLMNTDGVPVFRSSAFSFWPLFFLINELPFHLR